eukprot:CAMPEP_0172858960 /NCGR_PEP_ID=MMETSP1075-20121228/68449_1 /TAXON_ID=2916 /ORGANISM="Ceratium fusus, Strain PA161109" /LENGTH=123 /DNA_ID=CAMNT_0013706635 /DNA_START=97 /DNA_END=465 /DNA_ORIENTATION=+
MDRQRGIALIVAVVAAVTRGSPGFVAAPTGCVRFSAPLRASAQLGSQSSQTGFRTAAMARGGDAWGGEEAPPDTSDEARVPPWLPIVILIGGLYSAALLSNGFSDCTGGDYSPFTLGKCVFRK